ncbi:MAG: DUF1257 domain-containing protein [Cyanobacteriota bacterium]|jgi:hypothetical protein
MSHFSNIKTQLRDLDTLKTALSKLGMEWQEGPSAVRGYQGQTVSAALVISQENNYDLGFCWNGREYELVTDLQYWQQPLSVEGFLQKITQGYALETVLRESAQQGFQVAEQETQADGAVRLVVQRWSA